MSQVCGDAQCKSHRVECITLYLGLWPWFAIQVFLPLVALLVTPVLQLLSHETQSNDFVAGASLVFAAIVLLSLAADLDLTEKTARQAIPIEFDAGRIRWAAMTFAVVYLMGFAVITAIWTHSASGSGLNTLRAYLIQIALALLASVFSALVRCYCIRSLRRQGAAGGMR